MKKFKVIMFIIFFFFSFTSLTTADVSFVTQSDVDNASKWNVIAPDNPGIFYGDFSVSTNHIITSNSILRSSDPNQKRVLKANNNNTFFIVNGNAQITINNIVLQDAIYSAGDSRGGGALYFANSSTLNGNVSFERNVAMGANYGGAVCSSETLTITGNVSFLQNFAGARGGAVFALGDITFTDLSNFEIIFNTSTYSGGGIYSGGALTVGGGAIIEGNSSLQEGGGGIYSIRDISFTNPAKIIEISSNSAHGYGAGIFSSGSVTFAGGAVINYNQNVSLSADHFHGGGIYANEGVSFTSNNVVIELSNNIAAGAGGAIFANKNIIFNNGAIISSNKTYGGDGGAICSSSGYVSFDSYVNANYNEAVGSGGVICSQGILINDGGYFSNNKATVTGGAIYVYDSTTSYIAALTKDVLFTNNTKGNENLKNDIHMGGHSVAGSSNTLTFFAEGSKSIILDGGITVSGERNIVNKTGQGYLYMNGYFDLQNLNVSSGTVVFGIDSDIHIDVANFSNASVIDVNSKNPDKDIVISTITSSALIHYNINLDGNSLAKFAATYADMTGTKIKYTISGTDSNTKKYTIVISNAAKGAINIDNTNSEGKEMARVHSSIVYRGNHGSSAASWKAVDLNIQVDQLNAIEKLNYNQSNIAESLDKDYGASKGDFFYIIDQIDRMKNMAAKKNALMDLSGYIYANAITMPALNTSKNNVLSRLKRSYFTNDESFYKRNIWAQSYYADNVYNNGDINSPGDFKAVNSGVQVGMDTLKEDTQIFGVTFGFMDTKSKQNQDSVDIKGYNLGGYGSRFFDNNFETKIIIMGSRQNYSSSRNINYLNRTATSEFSGYSINTSAELSYNYYHSKSLCLRPFMGMDYAYISIDEFLEKGADSAGLIVFSGSYDKVDAVLGFQVNNGTGNKFKWYAEMKGDLILSGKSGKFTGRFKNGVQHINIKGIENDIFNATIGIGIFYDISNSFSAYANINNILSETQTAYYGNIGLNYKFTTEPVDFYARN